MMLKYSLFILLMSCCFVACKQTDQEKIVGKWQSERDWFDFKKDQTYDSGKDDITMVKQYKYTIDDQSKELNLYTNDKNSTFYLLYEFKGNDTLSVRNALSTNKKMVDFYRVK